MNNKKTLFLSIIGVVVLVLLVVGISYAIYRFSGTGSKENVISTGTVSVSYDEKSIISLSNQYPSSDQVGSTNAETLEFTVSANITGTLIVKYDLGIADITEGLTLKDNYIKFNLKKGDNYLLGTSETSGVTIGSRKDITGANGLISNYALDSGTFNATDNVTYVLKAWVSSEYDLPTSDTSTGTCSDTQYTTKVDCENAHNNWKPVHSNATTSETFKFKITVVASQ